MAQRRFPDGTPRLPLSRCPHCGAKHDAASVLQQGEIPQPQPGDFSVCFGCGEVLTYDRRLRLQRVAASTLAAMEPEEAANLRETQEAVRSFLASAIGNKRT
jgi:hypothetical protein